MFLYDPCEPLTPESFDDFDFVLLPDYKIEALLGQRFDLAINLASMQEMRSDQVERYLDFLQHTCLGAFYSCNRDHQKRNDELPGLFDLIRTRFVMTELPPLSPLTLPLRSRTRRHLKRSLRRVAEVVGLAERGGESTESDPYPFVEHLCHPRPSTT